MFTGTFPAAQCHFNRVVEADIVCEGHVDSGGQLSKSSVSPPCAAHKGTVKYDQVLMNRTAQAQFRGPEKLHFSTKEQVRTHHSFLSIFASQSCCQPRTKAIGPLSEISTRWRLL